MKKLFTKLLLPIIFSLGFLIFNAAPVGAVPNDGCLAATPDQRTCDSDTTTDCSPANCDSFEIDIATPEQGINPNAQIGDVLSNVITIIFVVAALMVLFMLIFGAFQWITSGGEKEAVAKARGRIMHALIGLAILALAFLLVRVLAGLVHIDLLNLTLPALDKTPTTVAPPAGV